MKYTVDFEKEINLMLKNNFGIYPYFRKNIRRFFERCWDRNALFCDSRHCQYCHPNAFFQKNSTFYLKNLLNNETSFENPLFHLLFKAFVYAEIRFIDKYIPQNSHEERLTGHLISEIANSLNIITETFKRKAFELYNSELNLEFHYADLSCHQNESSTGADFGLLFHINLPDYKEKVNVAIMQAKKFNKYARIDLTQFKTLEEFAKESGYYCFYDMKTNINGQNSPLIQKTDIIKSINDYPNTKSGLEKNIARNNITDPWKGGIPLSVFLILEMLNPENENIKSFANICEAAEFIKKPRTRLTSGENRISRVLIVSIGGLSNSKQELKDISKLFSYEEYTDEELR